VRCVVIAGLLTAAFTSQAQEPVWTAHYDEFRTGANTYEKILTPANVNPQSFGQLGRMAVRGCVVAQPLFLPYVMIPGAGVHNVVYVATTANMLYAFDADDFKLLFARNFGTPVSSYDLVPDKGYFAFPDCDGADDLGPVGITGTPVIDISSGAMYLVAATSGDDEARTQRHTLYEVSVRTGEDVREPVEIAGTFSADGRDVPFQSRYQLQRSALLLANGRVYIAFASHSDELPYQGWLFAYDMNLTQVAAYNYSPKQSGAGIWQAGAGPAFGGVHIYVTTGNNAEGIVTDADFADSILQLDAATLEVVAKTSFPNEANTWDYSSDIDLGSSRVIPLPELPYAVAGSKFGDVFVMNRADMRLVNRFQAAARHSAEFDWTGIYNGLAVWGDTVFVWPGGGGATDQSDVAYHTDTLKSYRVQPDGSTQLIASGQTDAVGAGYQGAGLAISSNGSDPQTAIVWAATPDGNGQWLRPGHLRAYAAASTGVFQQLWSDADVPASASAAHDWAKFSQPLIANGRVYLPTFSGAVLVFGLLAQ
jgi:outer membrane protein assembly factor BamB